MSPFNLDWIDETAPSTTSGPESGGNGDAAQRLAQLRRAVSEWVSRPEHGGCRCAACESLRRLAAQTG